MVSREEITWTSKKKVKKVVRRRIICLEDGGSVETTKEVVLR